MSALEQLNTALAGRYAVEREIGAGGMATVYLALDLKHQRHVALKVLLPELAAVLGVERFQSEIRVTANLQHPNLLPLFDSGEANGLLFYVMPYVEGESLRHRLDREKQLPVDEAVRIAAAVASALDYAHRHEVIHRDLKPENILLQDGQPLVADFGIALAVSKAGGQRVTQTGLSLGTPQYMSPEQATGDRVIDGRTDIYSLGALTYEMLTGEPPHLGTTAQAIIAKVLTEVPRSVRLGRPSVPEHVEAAVEKALEKLAADRWATAKEFGDALVNTGTAGATGAAGRKAAGRSGARPGLSARAQVGLAVVAALAGVVATRLAERWFDEKPVGRESRFVLALPDSIGVAPSTVVQGRIALSRDGAQFAYVSRGANGGHRLMIRSLADPVPRALPVSAGIIQSATFSPDGAQLAYVADGKVMKVSLAGGAPITLSDSGVTVEWRNDKELIVQFRQRIHAVGAEGGPARQIATPDTTAGQFGLYNPSVLPGGEHALLGIQKASGAILGVLELATGKLTELAVEGGNPRYDGDGHILFGRADGALFAVPFSLRRLSISGPEVLVAQGVSTANISVRTDFAVAHDGTLAFIGRSEGRRKLMAVDRRGVARPLSNEERLFGWPRISPDGRRIALEVEEASRGRWDVWIHDITTSTLSRLTSDYTGIRPAGWSSDGRTVYFQQTPLTPGGTRKIATRLWNGGAPPVTVVERSSTVRNASVGPAHTYLAMAIVGETTRDDIWIAPLDSLNQAIPLVATAANETNPRVSPDGRHIAYVSDESGVNEVYIRTILGPGTRVQVSSGGGTQSEWAPNGREIFFRGAEHLLSASLSAGADLAVTRRDTLFSDVNLRGPNGFQVFPNGREFLMISSEEGRSATVTVVINWQARLRKP